MGPPTIVELDVPIQPLLGSRDRAIGMQVDFLIIREPATLPYK